ncbi:magnesium transporter NIPA-domain-containing protein [Mycena pura]|uniref:Magnesium transporter NIPA-domain-containing protein n=1 Tax=Mycena pura TaxID=153505 RepID=A0AAD6V3C3_9AGAR|nr:magnesium transporter NIPA-domain-containing protein [Mycena pura]
MPDEKWIGLLLAIAASTAIGSSSVITKIGLTAAGRGGKSATENWAYLQNPIWWGGTLAPANFAAYTLAPPIMITPLGALSVIISAILASFILKERLGHLGRVGCGLCIVGTTIIVIHAPEDQNLETVTEFLDYALEPGFLFYCFTITVFCIVMAYAIAPTHGRTNPLVYISIASLVGGASVMFIKGFGVAIKLTFMGHNQFVYPSTYLFAVISLVSIMIQLNYINRALDIFSVNLVNPVYYVGFCTATIVASLILFKGFNTTSLTNTLSLLSGFLVTFLGVHILNLALLDGAAHKRTEEGLLGAGVGSRRASLNLRTPLFSADVGGVPRESVRLHRLPEVDELELELEDDDEDADERTALHSVRAVPPPGPDIRISPRPV